MWPPEGFDPPGNDGKPILRSVPPPPVEAPQKRSNRYDPKSKTQKKLARRDKAGMRAGMRERRDLFVDGLLLGLSRKEAASYAGVPIRSCARVGTELWHEPYVQQRFVELREKMDEEQLLSRKELILNVKELAFSPSHRALARVAASNLLAEIMDFKSPVKLESRFVGGVMVVHSAGSIDDWEKTAIEQQEQLKAIVGK
jgi:hypothetical protein